VLVLSEAVLSEAVLVIEYLALQHKTGGQNSNHDYEHRRYATEHRFAEHRRCAAEHEEEVRALPGSLESNGG
jgi:hypothetical protein